jgi:hypothetical protein
MSLTSMGAAAHSAARSKAEREKRRALYEKRMNEAFKEGVNREIAVGESYKIQNLDSLDESAKLVENISGSYDKCAIMDILGDFKRELFQAYHEQDLELPVPESIVKELKGLEKLVSHTKDTIWKADNAHARNYASRMIPQIINKYQDKIKGDAYADKR